MVFVFPFWKSSFEVWLCRGRAGDGDGGGGELGLGDDGRWWMGGKGVPEGVEKVLGVFRGQTMKKGLKDGKGLDWMIVGVGTREARRLFK